MTKEKICDVLAEFFLDAFRDDATGVAEWIAQGDVDVDEFVKAVKALRTTAPR